ncbi:MULTISPECIES: hypothetical protein [unclassified Pseudovibrio]|uniref:hypothetical protein n=1 Tax=unclassified Pseudovibrio TaxID=2627060 RepID=UPI001290101A|nr:MULTISPECIES: hypothetical protein [unclassified Pseudovibrio]
MRFLPVFSLLMLLFGCANFDQAIHKTREFTAPENAFDKNWPGYGFVIFPQKYTNAALSRHLMFCEAFLAALVPSRPNTSGSEIVLRWPVDSKADAARLNHARYSPKLCELAVEHYDLSVAQEVINLVRQQSGNEDFGFGKGPYLIAFSSIMHSGSSRLGFVLDFSRATLPDHANRMMRAWKRRIEQNPKLWKDRTIDIEVLKREIAFFADAFGSGVLTVFGVKLSA